MDDFSIRQTYKVTQPFSSHRLYLPQRMPANKAFGGSKVAGAAPAAEGTLWNTLGNQAWNNEQTRAAMSDDGCINVTKYEQLMTIDDQLAHVTAITKVSKVVGDLNATEFNNFLGFRNLLDLQDYMENKVSTSVTFRDALLKAFGSMGTQKALARFAAKKIWNDILVVNKKRFLLPMVIMDCSKVDVNVTVESILKDIMACIHACRLNAKGAKVATLAKMRCAWVSTLRNFVSEDADRIAMAINDITNGEFNGEFPGMLALMHRLADKMPSYVRSGDIMSILESTGAKVTFPRPAKRNGDDMWLKSIANEAIVRLLRMVEQRKTASEAGPSDRVTQVTSDDNDDDDDDSSDDVVSSISSAKLAKKAEAAKAKAKAEKAKADKAKAKAEKAKAAKVKAEKAKAAKAKAAKAKAEAERVNDDEASDDDEIINVEL
jgi:hypothetical protein